MSISVTARAPARSDHVGSFLRPPELLAEIHRVYERGHTTLHEEERGKDLTRLRELEDEAIRAVVAPPRCTTSPRRDRSSCSGYCARSRPRIETEDELLRRIDEATAYLPVEQLAISPQCGFASALSALDAVDGNELDEDVQWRKLEVQARVADRVWGTP